jgi:hypothetical protein
MTVLTHTQERNFVMEIIMREATLCVTWCVTLLVLAVRTRVTAMVLATGCGVMKAQDMWLLT